MNFQAIPSGSSSPPNSWHSEQLHRINAHYHQHLFSLRIDPHIDGPLNSVVEQEIEDSQFPTGSKENWAGNAFTTTKRILQTTGEAVRDANPNDERSWLIINENEKHYSTKTPVGYKIVSSSMPRLHMKHDSLVAVGGPFAKHHFWTVPYREDRLYPAGRYPTQTTELQKDSIEGWVGDGKESIVNKDILTFLTVGTTHIPRAEDVSGLPCNYSFVYLDHQR